MNIFLAITTLIIVMGALFYGFKKHKENKQRHKNMLNAMSIEDRQAYYASIEQKQVEYLEKIRKLP